MIKHSKCTLKTESNNINHVKINVWEYEKKLHGSKTSNLGGKAVRVHRPGPELRRDDVPVVRTMPENRAAEDKLLPGAPPHLRSHHHRRKLSNSHVDGPDNSPPFAIYQKKKKRSGFTNPPPYLSSTRNRLQRRSRSARKWNQKKHGGEEANIG